MPRKTIHTLVLVGSLLAGVVLFGASPAEASATPAMLANTCAGCHGTNGHSGGPAMPSIAGLPLEYLRAILVEFQTGARPSTVMGRIAQGYDQGEIEALARYFSEQPWKSASEIPHAPTFTRIDPEQVEKGAQLVKKNRCHVCHEENGKTMDRDTPRMGGQGLDYLIVKMHDYKDEHRVIPQPKKMAARIKSLSDEEVAAIAHFYASQK